MWSVSVSSWPLTSILFEEGSKQVCSWLATSACDTLTQVCDQVCSQVCSLLEEWNAVLMRELGKHSHFTLASPPPEHVIFTSLMCTVTD